MARYYSNHPEEWKKYNLFTNNCEHFVQFCATGKKRSNQVMLGTGYVVDRIGSRLHRTSPKQKESKYAQPQMEEMVCIRNPNIEDSALIPKMDEGMLLKSVS